jgi:L-threonylcarbamoyladenylate synthase
MLHAELISVNPTYPEPDVIARAAAVLRAGGLVAFPTETVYGLGADATNPEAVRRIFAVKGRPANNPLIVHVADTLAVRVVAVGWADAAARLAEHYWPGPLTLVLPRGPAIPDEITAGGPTVAIRVPAHPVARALIAAAGIPVAAPSANRSTRLSPTQADHVLRDLGGRIDMILDGGPTPGGLESTVLDLTRTPPRLLRPGLISPGQIEEVVGPIDWAMKQVATSQVPLPSPGMMPRHYAPRAPLELTGDDGWNLVQAHRLAGRSVGWLAFGTAPAEVPALVKQFVMPADPAAYARQLYATLHALDDAGVECIVAVLPPDMPEWLAVRDRLRRAAAT